MNGRKTLWLGLGLSIAFAAGFMGRAHASALAQSTLEVKNFEFLNAAGTASLDVRQFVVGSLLFQDSTNLNPSLNGTFNSFSNVSVGGAPLPLSVQCVPAACLAELNPGAPNASAVTPPTVNGALGASSLEGAPLAGAGLPPSASVSTAARAQLVSSGVASSLAKIGTVAQFRFQLTE